MSVTLTIAMEEAEKCLNCKNPGCMQGCPVQTPIPRIIREFKAGNLELAGKMLADNNPMTTVCCLVCDHERQCEGHCVLGKKGAPVHFSVIEDYVSTSYLQIYMPQRAEPVGRQIAVIGAGPAGITVATILAGYGYEITIFDDNAKIGGVMRYGIPKFRLPDAVLDAILEKKLKPLGIHYRPNTTVGQEIAVEDLIRDGYEAVFAGAGLWEPRTLGIVGETLPHVSYGFQYLQNPENYYSGKNVAIIGVGNSAIDCARTAVRQGAQSVTCYARRDKITASRAERESAGLEGISFVFCHKPVRITRQGIEFALTQQGEDGSFQERACPHEFCEADQVIICAGQISAFNLHGTGKSEVVKDHVNLKVDENGMTDFPGIFAGGDMTGGNLTVAQAVADAQKAAEGIHRYLSGADRASSDDRPYMKPMETDT